LKEGSQLNQSFVQGITPSFVSPEATMAVKNFQTVAVCAADFGVRVTGTDSMVGQPKAPLSLPGLPLPGYPIPQGPDADLRADNAAAAKAVMRTGRSVSGSARETVLSKRSSILFTEHRERQSMLETWSKLVRG